jgi:hypothetical protein
MSSYTLVYLGAAVVQFTIATCVCICVRRKRKQRMRFEAEQRERARVQLERQQREMEYAALAKPAQYPPEVNYSSPPIRPIRDRTSTSSAQPIYIDPYRVPIRHHTSVTADTPVATNPSQWLGQQSVPQLPIVSYDARPAPPVYEMQAIHPGPPQPVDTKANNETEV